MGCCLWGHTKLDMTEVTAAAAAAAAAAALFKVCQELNKYIYCKINKFYMYTSDSEQAVCLVREISILFLTHFLIEVCNPKRVPQFFPKNNQLNSSVLASFINDIKMYIHFICHI